MRILALALVATFACSASAQRLPTPLAEAVDAYITEHPGFSLPERSTFESLTYYMNEVGLDGFDPYVASGHLDGDNTLDYGVVLGGPLSADQEGWGWPVHDLRIVLFREWWDGLRVEHVVDASLPLAATSIAHVPGSYTGIVNHGLTYWIAETDASGRLEATSAGILPNPDDGYDTPEAELPLIVTADSILIDHPIYEYVVNAGVPVLDGDTATIRSVNETLARDIREAINQFKPSEPEDTTTQSATCGICAYVTGSFDVDLARQGVFSTLVTLDAYTGGAHGNAFLYAYTYDLRTGRTIAARDLFKSGSGWEQALMRLAQDGVTALRRERGVPASDARPSTRTRILSLISEGNPLFTLGPDVFIVHFPPYSVGSFAEGTYHVPIPRSALAPYLKASTPPGW